MKKVIIDGDWGGDEMQLAAVLLAHPDKINVLGATCVFGNTDQAQVVRNAGKILQFLGAPHIPYYPGAKGPRGETPPEGDNAHGDDGIGNVHLAETATPPQDMHAVDFILETLRRERAGTVTITATGPLTNIAMAIQKDPIAMARVAEIVVMGGCTAAMPAADKPARPNNITPDHELAYYWTLPHSRNESMLLMSMEGFVMSCFAKSTDMKNPLRKGNITPDAEFNFYMAPDDAQAVLDSRLPVTLFPMNCTQQLSLTPDRVQALIEKTQASFPVLQAIAMINAPAELDKMKFGASPFMHDVHTALYLIESGFYNGRKAFVEIANCTFAQGRTDMIASKKGFIQVMEKMTDPDAAFDVVAESLQKTAATACKPGSIPQPN